MGNTKLWTFKSLFKFLFNNFPNYGSSLLKFLLIVRMAEAACCQAMLPAALEQNKVLIKNV